MLRTASFLLTGGVGVVGQSINNAAMTKPAYIIEFNVKRMQPIYGRDLKEGQRAGGVSAECQKRRFCAVLN